MKDKYKAIEEQKDTNIVCDNKDCDFEFKNVHDDMLVKFVNMPCPDCGENLLTQEDINHLDSLRKVIKWINILFFPYMFLIGARKPGNKGVASYHHHAGVTTIKREDEQRTT